MFQWLSNPPRFTGGTTRHSKYYGSKQTDMISRDPHSNPKKVRLAKRSDSRWQDG
jgi:hypothetical protein